MDWMKPLGYLLGGITIVAFGSVAVVALLPTAIGYIITLALWKVYDKIQKRFFPEKEEKIKMSFFEKLYYRLFPKELEKKKQTIEEQERKEKADLLLEFEELSRKKEEMKKYIDEQTELLNEMSKIVKRATYGDPFAKGYNMRFARYLLATFDANKLDSYQVLKEKTFEYERLTFKMFVINQKLKLLGIDYRTGRYYD